MSLKNFFLKLGGSSLTRSCSTRWGFRSVEPKRNLLHLTSSFSSRYSFSSAQPSNRPKPISAPKSNRPKPISTPKVKLTPKPISAPKSNIPKPISTPKVKLTPPATGEIIYCTHGSGTTDPIGDPSSCAAGFFCFNDSLRLLGLEFHCFSVAFDITTVGLTSLEAAVAFAALKGHRNAGFRCSCRTTLIIIQNVLQNPKSIRKCRPSDQEMILRIISFLDHRFFDYYWFEFVPSKANQFAFAMVKWARIKMLTLSLYWEDGWVVPADSKADSKRVPPELSNLIRNWMSKLPFNNEVVNPYTPLKFGRNFRV